MKRYLDQASDVAPRSSRFTYREKVEAFRGRRELSPLGPF